MKTTLGLGIFLFLAAILLALAQLWLTLWNPAIFMKMEITLGALLLVVLVVNFVIKEYQDNKSIRRGDNLDD
jgi:uncharacterized membrane protein YcjF (UPF0283 family)